MANVLLLTNNTGIAAATNTKAALESGGAHTVTMLADSGFADITASDFDAVVVARPSKSQPLADWLRGLSVPLVIGGFAGGTGSTGATPTTHTDALVTLMGLSGDTGVWSNNYNTGLHSIRSQNPAHPIMAGLPTGAVQVFSGSNAYSVSLDGQAVGELLASGASGVAAAARFATAFAIEKGTPDLNGVPVNQRIVNLGAALYAGQSAYAADGITLLHNAIAWAIAPPGEWKAQQRIKLETLPDGPAPFPQLLGATPTPGSVDDGVLSVTGTSSHMQFPSLVRAHPAPQEILIRVRNPTLGQDFGGTGPTLHARGDSASGAQIGLMYRDTAGAQRLEINRITQGSSFSVVADVAYATPDVDAWYWMRFRYEGGSNGTYRGKMWRDGDTEPGWMVSTTYDMTGTSIGGVYGHPGIYFATSRTFEFDFIGYSADGSTVSTASDTDIDIDVGLLWNVHAPAETDASLAWHVRSPVEAERSVEWDVREAVQQDAALAWDVREPVTADRTLLWHVSPVITVDVDVGLLWNVRAPVEADRSVAWHVREAVEADSAFAWHVRAAVEAERSLLWQLRAAVNTDAVLRWNVGDAQTVELDVGLLWHVHAPVTIDRDLLWRIRERVELDRILRWNVGAAVATGTPLDVIRVRAVIERVIRARAVVERSVNVSTSIERVIRISTTV